jgi:hypothetical protein
VQEFNYSHFEKYYIKKENDTPVICSITDIMQNMIFAQSHTNIGLQIADILANCIRRAISNRLQFDGWKYLSSLIVRRKQNTIPITRFGGPKEVESRTTLANFVNYFDSCGKQMGSPPTRGAV